MTVAEELVDRAVSAVSPADREHLRMLTLTNLAAGSGVLGRPGELVQRLPFVPARPGDAAFVIAARIHARTQDDFHPATRVHAGAVALGAVLAISEITRERLLEALAAGYEAMGAAAAAYGDEVQRRGLRPTGIFGPIGAAAAASVALGLDRAGIANAIGLAVARSGGTMQSWLSGTDEWWIEAGAAARAGLESALFSQAGAIASAEAIEGAAGWCRAYFDDDSTRLRVALARGESYLGEVAVKPYPISGIAQVPTELGLLAFRAMNGRRVRSGVVTLSVRAASYPGTAGQGPFRSRSDALMSVPFCVACAITDGTLTLARLEEPGAQDVSELSARIVV